VNPGNPPAYDIESTFCKSAMAQLRIDSLIFRRRVGNSSRVGAVPKLRSVNWGTHEGIIGNTVRRIIGQKLKVTAKTNVASSEPGASQ
jgi:hypothetical protein